jgi:hypothetical protein
MDAAYIFGWVLGYAVVVGVGLLLTFWVVRAAILSALAEDRRRQSDRQPGWWDRPFGG